MSRADRVEQERLADLYAITRAHEPPPAPRRERAKNFAEAVGIGWFMRRVWNMFTN